jgi:hypothetical protein
MMKLKVNKTLTKKLKKKTRNQKNKDQIRRNNIWEIIIEWVNWKETKIS